MSTKYKLVRETAASNLFKYYIEGKGTRTLVGEFINPNGDGDPWVWAIAANVFTSFPQFEPGDLLFAGAANVTIKNSGVGVAVKFPA